MQFIVIVPFFVVVIAALLEYSLITAAAMAVGYVAWLIVWFILCVLYGLACFGGGGYLITVGAYRFIRIFLKARYDRVYPSWYLMWVGFGLTTVSWGMNAFLSNKFTREITHTKSSWFGLFTDTSYTIEYTSWHSIWSVINTTGHWILLIGFIYLIVEGLVRHWDIVSAAVISGAKQTKKGLDGPT